ncbi:MAG: asparagine synthase (glutamine-hydrolyzing) [Candidatus Flexifilum sp.]
MCGIFGQYTLAGADRTLVERMGALLRHRGPDGIGIHAAGPIAFGASRLAIIDLGAPAGAIFNEDGSAGVAFNGEIYNHRTLRTELERAGHVFATRTDTEVIIHGYEEWGDAVVERLRGMFALAIWDARRGRLLLARDRLGEKPLYFTTAHDGSFLFASEIKALFAHPGVRRAVDEDGIQPFLILGYVPPPGTLFAGIEKLAPGERLIVERGAPPRREVYWRPVMDASAAPSYDEAVQQVRAAVWEAVEMQMMADVPIGVFLSGGIDSTAVTAIMQRLADRPVHTFTVGFDLPPDSPDDVKFNVDLRYAGQVAAALGTDHRAIRVRADESIADLLPYLIYALDEPINVPTIIQTAYVAALARRSGVPVLLNGEAGDELFLGYNHYRLDRLLDRYLRLPGLLRRGLLTPLFERMPGPRFADLRTLSAKSRVTDPAARYLEWLRILDARKTFTLLRRGPSYEWTLRRLRPLLNEPATRHFADRIAFTSLKLVVAENHNMRVDKMAMAFSTESRAPLEDYRLVELALRLPLPYKLRAGDVKRVFKDAVRDLVPDFVMTRPKWGFNPPASNWLRGPLRPLLDRWLSREYVNAVRIFDADAIANVVNAHLGGQYELFPVWSSLIFHLWHAIYIDGSLQVDTVMTPDRLFAP